MQASDSQSEDLSERDVYSFPLRLREGVGEWVLDRPSCRRAATACGGRDHTTEEGVPHADGSPSTRLLTSHLQTIYASL